MKRWTSYIMLMSLALGALSCTVKEDRSGAPCYLTVHLDDADPEGIHGSTVIRTAHEGRNVSVDTLVIEEHIPDGYDIIVPKGMNPISSVSGYLNCRYDGSSLVVQRGTCFDRIFAYANLLDCRWDTYHDNITFSKQHAEIVIRPKTPVAGYYPYDMRIRGNTCGMDIYSLAPVVGPFDAYASRDRDGSLSTVVPRQADASLVLDIMRPDGTIEVSFQIGRMIEASGYDWTKTDLDDIVVTIDYASMDMSVKIVSWDDENKGVIVI